MRIRIVFFDALFTIVKPRQPIDIQYQEIFAPYFTTDPSRIKASFKRALKEVQVERPAYISGALDKERGAESWWREVIERTAIGAGADPTAVHRSLPSVVPALIHRFSSREGNELFDDTLPTLNALHERGIRTGLISNSDSRMRMALEDLGVMKMLTPSLFSEEERIEKPSAELWSRALLQSGMQNSEALHVGDEFKADYLGAEGAGLPAVLLQRPEASGDSELLNGGASLKISSLNELVGLIEDLEARRK
ncbi:HAD-like protein [Serendipita vermifera]|nr:HAD-like protein [Serendipita vermifera]